MAETKEITLLEERERPSWQWTDYPEMRHGYSKFSGRNASVVVSIQKLVSLSTFIQTGRRYVTNFTDSDTIYATPSVHIYKGTAAIAANEVAVNIDAATMANIKSQGFDSLFISARWDAKNGAVLYGSSDSFYFEETEAIARITALESQNLPNFKYKSSDLAALNYKGTNVGKLNYNNTNIF